MCCEVIGNDHTDSMLKLGSSESITNFVFKLRNYEFSILQTMVSAWKRFFLRQVDRVFGRSFDFLSHSAGGGTHRAALTQRSSLTRLGSTPSIRPPYPLR